MVEKCLITGASGLLGRVLVKSAIAKGFEVCSLYLEHSPDGGKGIRVDLTDSSSVNRCMAAEKPDIVINTASATDVDRCEREPEWARALNGNAAGILADACHGMNAFLVHLSTDYVFDGTRGNYNENDTPIPINQYGASKLIGEQLVLRHENTCVARTSVVFGWGRSYRPNFGLWLYNKLSKGEPVNVVSDQFASPTLNTNLANMLLELAERRARGLIHLAGATRISRFEFATKLANTFKFDSSLLTPVKSEFVNWIAKRPKDSSLDTTKARETLNSKPLEIEDAMQEFATTK
jgi:dTDP-4-dehydrorhamnose reductase